MHLLILIVEENFNVCGSVTVSCARIPLQERIEKNRSYDFFIDLYMYKSRINTPHTDARRVISINECFHVIANKKHFTDIQFILRRQYSV